MSAPGLAEDSSTQNQGSHEGIQLGVGDQGVAGDKVTVVQGRVGRGGAGQGWAGESGL